MMDLSVFVALAASCAPLVHTATTQALVATESSFNPYAIGVVGGSLVRQPRTLAEAAATARALQSGGWNFSLGLAQINVANFARLGLDVESALHPCRNLAAMQQVLGECYERAATTDTPAQRSLRKALSCYYSGNFYTGFDHGYVRRVVLSLPARALPGAPAAASPAAQLP